MTSARGQKKEGALRIGFIIPKYRPSGITSLSQGPRGLSGGIRTVPWRCPRGAHQRAEVRGLTPEACYCCSATGNRWKEEDNVVKGWQFDQPLM